MNTRPLRLVLCLATALLSACISIGSAGDAPPLLQYRLSDPATANKERRAQPLVDALLIQALPADALADTASMAYSRQPQQFGFYQFASWTERPVRALPRLLQRRLEAAGIAGAVGLLGEPLRADWLVAVSVDTLHHDVSVSPGRARLAVTVELIDRRSRGRVARQQFATDVTTEREDSAAAAAALSSATAQTFDALLPWLDTELQRALAKR